MDKAKVQYNFFWSSPAGFLSDILADFRTRSRRSRLFFYYRERKQLVRRRDRCY
ncbi:MAG: hypothetical protein AAGA60_31960 [Cyanobacteria bacterium P01_E01_bin.42]